MCWLTEAHDTEWDGLSFDSQSTSPNQRRSPSLTHRLQTGLEGNFQSLIHNWNHSFQIDSSPWILHSKLRWFPASNRDAGVFIYTSTNLGEESISSWLRWKQRCWVKGVVFTAGEDSSFEPFTHGQHTPSACCTHAQKHNACMLCMFYLTSSASFLN